MKGSEKTQEVLDALAVICVIILLVVTQSLIVYFVVTINACILAKIALVFCAIALSLPIISLTIDVIEMIRK